MKSANAEWNYGREKQVLGLSLLEFMLEKDIAKIIGTTEDNVSAIKRRTIKKLRKG